MKKTIIATAIALAAVIPSVFAGGTEPVSRKTIASFNKDFKAAHVLGWQQQGLFSVATFNLAGQVMMAYYKPDAMLAAVVHHITTNHLPILLLTDLKKNYSDYWITGLFEAAVDGQSQYHLTIENADQTITLKSSNSSDWEVIKTNRKI